MKRAGTLFMLFVLFLCEQPLEPTQPTVTSVTISPSEAELFVGDTLQFSAIVEGTGEFDSVLVWYVNNALSGNVMYGTITQNGFYTAPDTVPPDSQATVRAVSVADTSKWGSALVIILKDTTDIDTTAAPTVTSVAISPIHATVRVNQSVQFTATVTGVGDFDSTITWYVNRTAGENTEYGAITPEGLYTAPVTVPAGMQATVRAVSIADSTKRDSVVVSVYSVESVAVSPQFVTVEITQTAQFAASVVGIGSFDPDVLWYVNRVEGGAGMYGTIASDGLYQAPDIVPAEARVWISAWSIADSLVSDSAIVDLYIIDSVTITPQPDSLYVHQEQRFSLLVYGEGNYPGLTMNYFVNGVESGSERYGYIDGVGLYKAPPTVPYHVFPTGEAEREEVTVRVVLVTDSSKHDATSFIITSGITALGIVPTITSADPGDSIQFTVTIYGNPVDSTVEWFVSDPWGTDGGLGGNERVGTISESGFYIAPDSTSLPFVWLGVQSVADRAKGATGKVYF